MRLNKAFFEELVKIAQAKKKKPNSDAEGEGAGDVMSPRMKDMTKDFSNLDWDDTTQRLEMKCEETSYWLEVDSSGAVYMYHEQYDAYRPYGEVYNYYMREKLVCNNLSCTFDLIYEYLDLDSKEHKKEKDRVKVK